MIPGSEQEHYTHGGDDEIKQEAENIIMNTEKAVESARQNGMTAATYGTRRHTRRASSTNEITRFGNTKEREYEKEGICGDTVHVSSIRVVRPSINRSRAGPSVLRVHVGALGHT